MVESSHQSAEKRLPLLYCNESLEHPTGLHIQTENKNIIDIYNLTLPRSFKTSNPEHETSDGNTIGFSGLYNTSPMSESRGIRKVLLAKLSLVRGQFQSQQICKAIKDSRLMVYLLLLMMVLGISLIFAIYVIKSNRYSHSDNGNTSRSSATAGQEEKSHCWGWKNILTNLEGKSKLHLQTVAEESTESDNKKNSCNLTKITSPKNDVIELFGRPAFCKELFLEPPNDLKFNGITHLHLTKCNHCLQLILNNWEFPAVIYIKLQGVIINEEEFIALNNFVDRHKSSLLNIVIEDSYLCPTSACDVGMINLPNDDLEIHVSGIIKDANLVK